MEWMQLAQGTDVQSEQVTIQATSYMPFAAGPTCIVSAQALSTP